MSTKSALLIAVMLLGGIGPSAWGQSRGRPAPAPVYDAVHDDRSTASDRPGDRGEDPEAGGIWRQLSDWTTRALTYPRSLHRPLADRFGNAAASAVLASPLLVLLLVMMARRRRRPSSRRASSAARRNANHAAAATTSRAKGRQQHKRVTVALSAAEEPLEGGPAPFQAKGAQELLLRLDERGGASLHETLCALGAEPAVLDTLRFALEQCFDETAWSTAIADRGTRWVRRARGRWIAETAAQRLADWVAAHPLVQEFGYRVDTAAAESPDDGWQVKLLLTQPSGLAASLDDGQQRLLQRVEAALDTICATAHNPHTLVAVARQTDLSALLPMPDDPHCSVRLAALCHGMDAFDHAATLGLVPTERARELRNALTEHERTVGGTVAGAGCAVHTLFLMEGAGSTSPDIGALLAAVAGAAFSASAVTLRLSKEAGLMRPARQREALEALGQRALQWLAEPGKGDAAIFEQNLRRLLGHETLAQASSRNRAALRAAGKKPLWSGGPHESPETALLRLHDLMLANLREQTAAAERRARAILTRLAYSGQDGQTADIATRRLGYAMASLGTELVRGVNPEVLSMMREAMAVVRA